MHADVQQLIKELEAAGYEVTLKNSGHYEARATDARKLALAKQGFTPLVPNRGTVTFSATPSNPRSVKEARADLKRKLGFGWSPAKKSDLPKAELIAAVYDAGPDGITVSELCDLFTRSYIWQGTRETLDLAIRQVLRTNDKVVKLPTKVKRPGMQRTAFPYAHEDALIADTPDTRTSYTYDNGVVKDGAACTECGASYEQCTRQMNHPKKSTTCCGVCFEQETHDERVVSRPEPEPEPIPTPTPQEVAIETAQAVADEKRDDHAGDLEALVDMILAFPLSILEDEGCQAQLARLNRILQMTQNGV